MKAPPLALYAHFPWCVQKCPYCDFNSYTLKEPLPEQRYIDVLLRDLEAQLFGKLFAQAGDGGAEGARTHA